MHQRSMTERISWWLCHDVGLFVRGYISTLKRKPLIGMT